MAVFHYVDYQLWNTQTTSAEQKKHYPSLVHSVQLLRYHRKGPRIYNNINTFSCRCWHTQMLTTKWQSLSLHQQLSLCSVACCLCVSCDCWHCRHHHHRHLPGCHWGQMDHVWNKKVHWYFCCVSLSSTHSQQLWSRAWLIILRRLFKCPIFPELQTSFKGEREPSEKITAIVIISTTPAKYRYASMLKDAIKKRSVSVWQPKCPRTGT